jgi:hypothetical protein
MLPFADRDFESVCVLLDGITHACEHGLLDDEKIGRAVICQSQGF